MADITFSVQVIPDKNQDFKCNAGASALEVIGRVAKSITDQDGKPIDLREYRVLVAYQLLSPEMNVEKIFQEDLPNPIWLTTLDDLKIQSGYYLFFLKPAAISTKLRLQIGSTIFELEKAEVSIGRQDIEKGIIPDLDLIPYLGENELKVSRQLLILTETGGVWKLKLHPNAKTSVFLDSQKLQHNIAYNVQNDSAISIGSSPENPFLRITTKLMGD
jgi:hypothetical protein